MRNPSNTGITGNPYAIYNNLPNLSNSRTGTNDDYDNDPSMVIGKLVKEIQRIQTKDKKGNNYNNSNNNNNKRFNGNCNICGKYGHKASQCRNKNGNQNQNGSQNNNRNNYKCQYCDKTGHTAKYCRELKEKKDLKA